MKTEIENYLKKHDACREGAAYALTQNSMKEVWDNCPKIDWLLWILIKEEKSSEKELRLFAVWCARQVQHLMTDKRSLDALDVAERFARGNATAEELTAARTAAWDAAWAAERAAAEAAARTAARTAARGAAWDAAWDAAWAAERAAQVKQFKLMIQNPFK